MYHFNSYFYTLISLLLLLFFEYHAFESNVENDVIISREFKLFDELNSLKGIQKRSVSKKKSDSNNKVKEDKSKSKDSKTTTKSKGSGSKGKSKDSNSKKKKPQKEKKPYEKELQKIYDRINKLRKKFKENYLKVKESMEKEARKLADDMCHKNIWGLVPNDFGFTLSKSEIYHGIDPLYPWTSGIRNMNYNDEVSMQMYFYYTQLIWKKTTEIGCGISNNTESYCIYCLFFPAGNIPRQYKYNIPKPSKTVRSPIYDHYFRLH